MAKLERFKKNEMVIRQGDKSNGKCYVIVEGRAMVTRLQRQ